MMAGWMAEKTKTKQKEKREGGTKKETKDAKLLPHSPHSYTSLHPSPCW
jgi:hypothetical protein